MYIGNIAREGVPKANSAFHPSGVSKWVPASAGKAKAGMVHSVSGWTRGVQVKLWDPLRTRAIPERLRGVSRRGAIQIHVYLTLPFTKHISTTPNKWLPRWWRDPAWPTPFSVAVSVRPDQWCVFCTPSLAIVPTRCNQLDSNLGGDSWGGINL